MVIFAHAGGAICWWFGWPVPLRALGSGFFGVELFFALSGFLIGRLLLELVERDPSPRGWWRFMARRWLRTLPLYFLVLFGQALIWPPPGDVSVYLLKYGALVQNLAWPMPPDNWFGVSWSLTVEEWFYLLFSALLLGCTAITQRHRSSGWAVIAIFIAAPVILRWQVPDTVDWETNLRKVALLRLNSITYGVAIATFCHGRNLNKFWRCLMLAVGLAIVFEQWFEPVGLLVLPYHAVRIFSLTSGPLACALCLPAATLVRDLAVVFASPVRWLSQHAYPIYLVHLPLLDAVSQWHVQYGLSPVACVILAAALIVGISHGLHRWIEVPIMVRRPRQYPAGFVSARQPLPTRTA